MTLVLDGIVFHLAEHQDFGFLSRYGKVFCAFDQNDSGNISFGLIDENKHRYFVKIAGAKTMQSVVSTRQAVDTLKSSVALYQNLQHEALIQFVEAFSVGDLHVAVFEWVDGDCLFDHWNFEKYADEGIKPPYARFKDLPAERKHASFLTMFDFLCHVEDMGYVAVDFYDGSILYDFYSHTTHICDIDLFRKCPAYNEMGIGFPGTKRLKAPEEYKDGAMIDSLTNIFTLGALIFHFFGGYTGKEIQAMYKENRFFSCTYSNWFASEALYRVALKAVSGDRENRYHSMAEFRTCWMQAMG